MKNKFGLNEYESEWAKRGGVIVASYSHENNGEGGSFTKSFLVKKLAENVFIGAETLSEKGDFCAQESFEPQDIDDFSVLGMATREICIDAGVDYIEPPILDESESMRQEREINERHRLELELEELRKDKDMNAVYIAALEFEIRNLHKVKGRYHTQQALENLFKLVGLENNIGEKNE
jgi:hypothetical protein